jgi:uncharacterized membrane protein
MVEQNVDETMENEVETEAFLSTTESSNEEVEGDNVDDIHQSVIDAVSSLINDESMAWSMKTWKQKVGEIICSFLSDNVQSIIKGVVIEAAVSYILMSQNSQESQDESQTQGSQDNFSQQSEYSQYQVILLLPLFMIVIITSVIFLVLHYQE